MPEEAIARINFVVKKEKRQKGLRIANCNNVIQKDNVNTNVMRVDAQENQNNTNAGTAATDQILVFEPADTNDVESQNDIEIEEDTGVEVKENIGANGSASVLPDEEDFEDENNRIAPVNREDEVAPSNNEDEEELTRSGRISKPYNWEENFPALYGDSNMIKGAMLESVLLQWRTERAT